MSTRTATPTLVAVAGRRRLRRRQPGRRHGLRGGPVDHRAAARLAGRLRPARRARDRRRRGPRPGAAPLLRRPGGPDGRLLVDDPRRLRGDGGVRAGAGPDPVPRRRGARGRRRAGPGRAHRQGGAQPGEVDAARARGRPGRARARLRGAPGPRPGGGLRRAARGRRRGRVDRRHLAGDGDSRPAGRRGDRRPAAGPPAGGRPAGEPGTDGAEAAADIPAAHRPRPPPAVLALRRLRRADDRRPGHLRRDLLPPGARPGGRRGRRPGRLRGRDGRGRPGGTGHRLAARPVAGPRTAAPAGHGGARAGTGVLRRTAARRLGRARLGRRRRRAGQHGEGPGGRAGPGSAPRHGLRRLRRGPGRGRGGRRGAGRGLSTRSVPALVVTVAVLQLLAAALLVRTLRERVA